MTDSTGTLVVREIRNDGKQEVYLLSGDGWTLYEFQMWLFGFTSDGGVLSDGPQRNEILAYYPTVDPLDFDSDDHPLLNTRHPMWADPDGMPTVWS